MINFLLLFLMTVMGAFAGFNLKIASQNIKLKNIFKNKFLYIGGILYFISALLNIYLLKIYDYTFVLPFTSVTYIWSFVIAKKFLEEKITLYKLLGITSIIIGVILLSIGGK